MSLLAWLDTSLEQQRRTDPLWAAELDRSYIENPQVHSETAGQYVTFGYRGIRWQLAADASGDTTALVLGRDYRLTSPWSENLTDVERTEHHIYPATIRDAVNDDVKDNHRSSGRTPNQGRSRHTPALSLWGPRILDRTAVR